MVNKNGLLEENNLQVGTPQHEGGSSPSPSSVEGTPKRIRRNLVTSMENDELVSTDEYSQGFKDGEASNSGTPIHRLGSVVSETRSELGILQGDITPPLPAMRVNHNDYQRS